MIAQRWRDRRDSYRPAGETIRTSAYEVAPIPVDAGPKAFIVRHHYSASYPAARFRFGLYTGGKLAGVAVFSVPMTAAVLTSVFPCNPAAAAELGRFVLLDDVPANGETWFLGRCFDLLRGEGMEGILSTSDPVPRTAIGGRVVFPGHLGIIYQAFNGICLGRTKGRVIRLLPDGTVLSDRSIQKLRAWVRGETDKAKGWQYVAEMLVRHGATEPCRRKEWLNCTLAALTRPLRHPGNHKYAWGLDRAMRKVLLPKARAYPKPVVVPSLFEVA